MRVLLFNIMVTLFFLASCSSVNTPIEVVDSRSPSGTKVLYHHVSVGETLYSIAWRYNLNYKRLARANHIGADFMIHPGQRILLDDKVRPVPPLLSVPKSSAKLRSKLTQVTPTLSGAESRDSNANTKLAPAKPVPEKLAPILAKSKSKPLPKKVLVKTSQRLKKQPVKVNKSSSSNTSSFSNTWQWPATGRVLEKFHASNGLNKGIDIGGKLGEPVLAASAGKVVYAGEGLRGYGKLIIVKHSEKYLSAYGHNKKVLVSEGDNVEIGQKIALLGSTGTDRVKLHFEIRDQGKPVNPLLILPKK